MSGSLALVSQENINFLPSSSKFMLTPQQEKQPMKKKISQGFLPTKVVAATLSSSLLVQACAGISSRDIKPITINGSSTVAPITEKVLTDFQANPPNKVLNDLKIDAQISGTGGGFKKFCAGETDINNASRPISIEEMKACDANKVRFIELPIAFDALTVVVNPQNNWLDTITTGELKTMWEPSATNRIKNWNQVNPAWPDKPLTLHGPGKDSGTYDYFSEAINGQDASRSDYNFSEDDRALVNAVSQDPNALGYFGHANYEQNRDKLKALKIDNGNGGIEPTRENVEKGQYQPLSRPLFIYVNASKAQENPALEAFVEYYLEQVPNLVQAIGYIPLTEEGYHLARIHFQKFKVGTVFDGRPQPNLTIGELLRKQAKFQAQ
jgi:phosphate transport system substrate-binding protein